MAVKRVLAWIAPALALAAVVGICGYRTLAQRRTRSSLATGEGAASTEPVGAHRLPPRPGHARWPSGPRSHGGVVVAAAQPSVVAPAAPAEAPAAAPPRTTAAVTMKPEEAIIRHKLEPLVASRKDTDLRFVVCEPFSAPPADQAQSAEDEPNAFDSPPKDPAQPVCRARVESRDRNTLGQVVREASTLYGGHVAVEVREHMTAFTGVWYEADLRVDTDEPQPLPSDI